MILTFILGLVVAGIGALVSLAAQNWQVGFILCGTVSLISILMASLFQNLSLIMRRTMKVNGSAGSKSLEDLSKWAKTITLFATPSIVTTAVLYFKLYR